MGTSNPSIHHAICSSSVMSVLTDRGLAVPFHIRGLNRYFSQDWLFVSSIQGHLIEDCSHCWVQAEMCWCGPVRLSGRRPCCHGWGRKSRGAADWRWRCRDSALSSERQRPKTVVRNSEATAVPSGSGQHVHTYSHRRRERKMCWCSFKGNWPERHPDTNTN